MTTFNIYMVRHGQTFLNKYHRIQGIIDSPLTEAGIADAKRAGDRLSQVPFTAAYSSDAKRANDTGKLILERNVSGLTDPIVEPAFKEENFGYFEGNDDVASWHMIGGPDGYKTFNEMIAAWTIEGSKDHIRAADPYKDAEDNDMFWARVQPALDKLIAAGKDGDKILIASHGTIIRSIVSKYNKTINVAESTANGSVTKFTVTDGEVTVDYFNSTEGPVD